MTPVSVFSRLPLSESSDGIGIRLYIWNSGWMITCCGSRLPAVNTSSSTMLNRQLKRLTANATTLDSTSVRISAGTTMQNVTQ